MGCLGPLASLESVETRESLAREALQVSRVGERAGAMWHGAHDGDQTKPWGPPKGILLNLNDRI